MNEPAITLRLISDPAELGLVHVHPACEGDDRPPSQHWYSMEHDGVGVRRRGGNMFEWRSGDGWGRVRGLPNALTMLAFHTPALAHLCALTPPEDEDDASSEPASTAG